MEKIKTLHLILTSGVALLASCASEAPDAPVDPGVDTRVPVEVVAEVYSAGTRATATAFETGDQIGITPVSRSSGGTSYTAIAQGDDMYRYRNARYTKGSDGIFKSDESGGVFFENDDSYLYNAYYPFYGVPGGDQTFEINTFTSQNEGAIKRLDIMTAGNTTSKSDADSGNKLTFTGVQHSFKHLMSKVVFRVILDENTFKDYDDDTDNITPDIATYLDKSSIQVTGLVHTANFNTRTLSLTNGSADSRSWDLTTAQAPRKVYEVTTDESGNSITPYKVLEYEVLVIPQSQSNVRMALVYQDGTRFESGDFNVKFEAGTIYHAKMKAKRTELTIDLVNGGGAMFKAWEDGGSGNLETPTGDSD